MNRPFDVLAAPHHGSRPAFEIPDPPCTCIRIDVDRYDAAGCELCDPRSAYNASAPRVIEYAPARPEPAVWEVPF